MQAVATYTGPDFHTVNARDARQWDVTDNHGKRIGTYPSSDMAHRVRNDADKLALRAHLKAQRKARGAAK